MSLKLNWYKFKLDGYYLRMLNVIPMVTTNLNAVLKRVTIKNELNTIGGSNTGSKGQKPESHIEKK